MSDDQSDLLRKRRVYRQASTGLRRIAGDQSGAVLVETAVVMLILVPLLIGLSELSEALTLKRRVETAAATAADLVTRAVADGSKITTSDLDDVGLILRRIVEPGAVPTVPIGFRVVNFSVEFDDRNGDGKEDEGEERESKKIGSYACGFTGTGVEEVQNDLLLAAGIGDRIVLVETEHVYTSSFARFIAGEITLGGTSYFAPRIGNAIDLSVKSNPNCTIELPPTDQNDPSD